MEPAKFRLRGSARSASGAAAHPLCHSVVIFLLLRPSRPHMLSAPPPSPCFSRLPDQYYEGVRGVQKVLRAGRSEPGTLIGVGPRLCGALTQLFERDCEVMVGWARVEQI